MIEQAQPTLARCERTVWSTNWQLLEAAASDLNVLTRNAPLERLDRSEREKLVQLSVVADVQSRRITERSPGLSLGATDGIFYCRDFNNLRAEFLALSLESLHQGNTSLGLLDRLEPSCTISELLFVVDDLLEHSRHGKMLPELLEFTIEQRLSERLQEAVRPFRISSNLDESFWAGRIISLASDEKK